ncbi:MAG: PIN domain-containing protein [Candidatus Sulfotelmatobacter sp.]|jgi:predicted nucleic acid-binding protein
MTAPGAAKSPSVQPSHVGPAPPESPIFVDTNVFLYAIDEGDPKKQRAAQHWRAELWKTRRGRVSFQVLAEFYVNAVRKQSTAQNEARDEVRDLLAWNPVVIDAALLERGWEIQDRYQLSYWDALIVAAAQAASCRYLLTEDLQGAQSLGGIEVVNPFLHEPESIL